MTPRLLVADTHPFVWYITAQFNKLPKKVKKAFDYAVEGRCAIFIPVIVLWELSILIKTGIIRPSVTIEEYVHEHFFAKAISVLDLETEDVLRSHGLAFSRDPFDVLIVAMTLRADCPLVTADGVIHDQKPCELFWD